MLLFQGVMMLEILFKKGLIAEIYTEILTDKILLKLASK